MTALSSSTLWPTTEIAAAAKAATAIAADGRTLRCYPAACTRGQLLQVSCRRREIVLTGRLQHPGERWNEGPYSTTPQRPSLLLQAIEAVRGCCSSGRSVGGATVPSNVGLAATTSDPRIPVVALAIVSGVSRADVPPFRRWGELRPRRPVATPCGARVWGFSCDSCSSIRISEGCDDPFQSGSSLGREAAF